MAVRRVQLRRGNTNENNNFTGAIGEITVDTDTDSVRVHDGALAGGRDLLRADMSNNASIATNINFTNADRTVGGAMTTNGGNPTVLTLGGDGSKVVIAGNLQVTGSTTQADSLLVESRVIQIADGAEADANNNDDIGIFFTRSLEADGVTVKDKGLFFWDEAGTTFKLGLDGNSLTSASINFDTDDANYTPASLSLGSLSVNEGNITNVGDIALDSISADGDTIGMTLKQAGGATAFTIVDNDGAGANTFLSINATDGADKLTISTTSLDVSSVTSIDNAVTINDSGADKDFRVEGTGKANALFVQGSDGFVGLNNGTPTVQLDVVGDALITGSTTLEGAVVINDTGADVDFRVEGDTDTNLLYVDASADAVGISTATPSKTLDVAGTFGVSSKSTLAGSLDLTTASSDGITFRSEIAENGADADATLLRVNIGGTDGGGSPNYKSISWVAASDTFSLDGSTKILGGDVVLGSGTNATSISVVDQTAGGNTLGEHLTISAGKGQGTEAGGSVIFKTQSVAGGALTEVLTLDKTNKATFTGDIDFSNGAVLGAGVGDAETLTLGGHTGSTTNVAGILKVTGNTIQSSGASAISMSGANVDVLGTLEVSGNEIKQSDTSTVITFSGDANKTATFAGNIVATTSISATTSINATTTLAVQGDGATADITLGDGTNAGKILTATQTEVDTAGEDLTISAGIGDGTGVGGSLFLSTGGANAAAGLAPVLKLDKDKDATFYGDINFSADSARTIGEAIGANTILTLGGNVASVTKTAGNLLVQGNTAEFGNGATIVNSTDALLTITEAVVQVAGNLKLGNNVIVASNDATAITLTGANVAVEGNLTVNGTGASALDFTNADVTIGGTVGNTKTITLGGDAGSITKVAGLLTVAGNVIRNSEGTPTLTMDANEMLTVAGKLTVGGTGGIELDQGATIVNTSDAILTIDEARVNLTGDLTVGGNTILAQNNVEAIQLTGADVATKGALSVEGTSLTLSTNTGGAPTIKPFTRTTVNGAGSNLILQGGSSDGTGAGGSIVFKTQPTDAGGNGSQEANQAIALTIAQDKSAVFTGDVTVNNLTVNGTTTTIDTDQLTIVDPILILNKDANADGVAEDRDSGLFLERRGEEAALMYWDEGDDRFIFATTSAEGTAVAFGGTTTLQTIKSKAIELDGGGITIDTVNSDFVISDAGVITSKNTASFTANNATSFVVADTVAGGKGNVLVVDTIAGHVETQHIMPLVDSTYDLGTSVLRFNEGFFNSLDVDTDIALSGTGAFTGAITYSTATTINVETSVTNGITFRSNAEADARADATLLRVLEGNNTNTFSTLSWDESYDGFSFSSNANSVGDFGVGAVGAETFKVTASTGAVNIEGDITTATNENKAIFAGVTSNTITLGGGGTSIVAISNDLEVTGNTIASSGASAIQLADANVEVLGNLTVSGTGGITLDQGATLVNTSDALLTITEATVALTGDLTVQGADIQLGTDDDTIPTTLTPVARTGADKAGNSLTIKGGQSTGSGAGGDVVLQTSITGDAGVGANAFQTIMTLNTAGEVVLGTNNGGQEIIRAETSDGGAGNNLVIASGLGDNAGTNDGSLILRSGSTAVLTLDSAELATFAGNVQIDGSSITVANADVADARNIFSSTTGTITIGGAGAVELGGTLKIAGQTISGRADSDLIINSDTDLTFRVDADDNAQDSKFNFKNGDDATIAEIDESGNLTLSSDLTVADTIKSATGLIFHIDTDDNGGNTFSFVQGAGAGTEVASINESGDLQIDGDITVSGRDIALGVDESGGATTIAPVTSTSGTGASLTISSGVGHNGNGTNDGNLVLRTGATNVLSFDTSEKASFSGNGVDAITLNSSFSAANNTTNVGITVKRGTGDTGSATIFYDEASGDTWKVNRGEGAGNEIVLTENDTLFTIKGADDATTITLEQTDDRTLVIDGIADAINDNTGLLFKVSDANTIQASFATAVEMPGTLVATTSVTSGFLESTGQLLASGLTQVGSLNITQTAGGAKTAITLNSDNADAPADAEDVSIAVERGSATNATLTWDEGDDRWTLDQGAGTSSPIVTTTASEGARPSTTEPTFDANATTISAPTAVQNEHIYFLDNGNVAQGTVNLFALAGTTYNGYKITFVNIDAGQNMVIDGSDAQQVGGADTQTVASGASLTIVAYGTAWYVI